ncbi:hypothetical protein [Peterkaempfera bronchialis]|uniref:hypothetical protein n=1 Tax=Peterkaempfera bronchialis TaxID=2126346 RepID=UPI003C2FBE02
MAEERGTAPVWVHYRQFYVIDPDLGTDEVPDIADIANGLVAAETDGVSLLTGLDTGPVAVSVAVHPAEPHADDSAWEEVVEVSFTSTTGTALVASWEDGETEDLPNLASTGPGTYRLRVHARGRDAGRDQDSLPPDADPVEHYLLQAWPAPPAPEKALLHSDRVGAEWRET